MSLELEGVVKSIGEEQTFKEGSFKKKEILLETKDGSYSQIIPMDASQKNLNIFDAVNVGDTVKVDINLRGSEWNGNNYVSINAWRVAVIESGGANDVADNDPAQDASAADASPMPVDDPDDDTDDLPF